MDIAAWLRGLGLQQYEQTFHDHAIDADILSELDEEHLKELGLPLGHRLKLLKGITVLRGSILSPSSDIGPQAASEAEILLSPLAERRQLTVMFIDLVGSIELSTRLDPEDMGEVIRGYQDACAGVITRFGGHIAQHLGDGVLAYFGYPRTHEDVAERTIRAGLGIIEAVRALRPLIKITLHVRIGITTGLVVVGDLIGENRGRERTAIGETPNLAARLLTLAEPDEVIIGCATRRLLGDLFEIQDLGVHYLKGFSDPVQAWRVLGEGRAESRFEALHGAGLTPLIGREDELGTMQKRWKQAKEGEGHVILLTGEPGIGKSRLIRDFREWLGDAPHTLLCHDFLPQYQDTALHPIVRVLERAADFTRNDPPERRLAKLEAILTPLTESPQETAALLAALLLIDTGNRYPPLIMSPQRQRQRTLAILIDQLAGLAARGPVLAVYEDIQWSDPTSLELLDLAIDRVQALPVLVIATSRPGSAPRWAGQSNVTLLTLSRLSRRQVTAMVDHVAGGKALPAKILDEIWVKADGVPLFVEELTKAVLEVGVLEDAGERYVLSSKIPRCLAIPATLHDSLLARLDRLAPVKEVAQVGATIGREFPYELLAAVLPIQGNELQDALARLEGAELVFRRGAPPEAVYRFKHALMQDAAYRSLLRSRRRELHTRIAAALEEHFPGTVKAEPELLAHHCAEAGLVEKAVGYWLKAGELAIRRSALAEAIAQLRKGLDLLSGLADGPERRRQELDVQLTLGGALVATKGFAAPETGAAWARARQLCREVGETPQLFRVLYGQYSFHLARANFDTALEVAMELLRLAQERQDVSALVIGHRAAGVTSFHCGELASARAHLEQALTLYDPLQHRSLAFLYVFDPYVVSVSYLGATLFALGYLEQASERSREALARARELGHPGSLAFALSFGCTFFQFERNWRAAKEQAEALISIATEQGFAFWLASGVINRGWALAVEGRAIEGITQLREGLTAYQATASEPAMTYFSALLADAHRIAGQAAEGEKLLVATLERVGRTGERYYEAELYRLRGELLLVLPDRDPAHAETCFRRALAVARNQSARMWELRAAISLARLWRDQGRSAEAADLLAPVYAWFTEGFDMIDLKEAQVLLDELRSAPIPSTFRHLCAV